MVQNNFLLEFFLIKILTKYNSSKELYSNRLVFRLSYQKNRILKSYQLTKNTFLDI